MLVKVLLVRNVSVELVGLACLRELGATHDLVLVTGKINDDDDDDDDLVN